MNYTRFIEQFIMLSHHFPHTRMPGATQLRSGNTGPMMGGRPRSADGSLRMGPWTNGELRDNPEVSRSIHKFIMTRQAQETG